MEILLGMLGQKQAFVLQRWPQMYINHELETSSLTLLFDPLQSWTLSLTIFCSNNWALSKISIVLHMDCSECVPLHIVKSNLKVCHVRVLFSSNVIKYTIQSASFPLRFTPTGNGQWKHEMVEIISSGVSSSNLFSGLFWHSWLSDSMNGCDSAAKI